MIIWGNRTQARMLVGVLVDVREQKDEEDDGKGISRRVFRVYPVTDRGVGWRSESSEVVVVSGALLSLI